MSIFKKTLINWDTYVKYIDNMAGVIIEDMYKQEALTQYHTIMPNVKAKKQIAYLNRVRKILKKATDCGPGTYTEVTPGSKQKFWDPQPVEARIKMCYKDLEQSFLVWLLSSGKARRESVANVLEFMLTIIAEALGEDALRIAWFANTTITDIAGSGTLVNGQIPNYNQLDGFWKQLFAIATATASRRVTITENAGANYNAQKLATDAAYGYFQTAVEQVDSRIWSQSGTMIRCTKSMMLNYKRTLRSKNLESSFTYMQDGIPVVTFDGVPVIEFEMWDRTILEDFNNGTKLDMPNRFVLTTPNNLAVGFDGAGPDLELGTWYDRDTKEVKGDTEFMQDAKVIKDEYVLVGY